MNHSENEINTFSAGTKPALKHVKVYPEDHELISNTVKLLREKFRARAQAIGIKIQESKKFSNLPGQQDAVKCLFSALQPGNEGLSVENLTHWYIEELIQRAKGVV